MNVIVPFYNVWSQVLTYFDAFIVGLTATPDNRTFAFFNENIVSEYPREQAIVDGVNVGEDIFLIETQVGKNGGFLMKQLIEYRDRLSRAKRWRQMDEDKLCSLAAGPGYCQSQPDSNSYPHIQGELYLPRCSRAEKKFPRR